MIRNYFRVAFRNFKNNKLFSLINIGGLAIGISAALVIYLIVQYEFSFDKFHKDEDRLYRVVSNIKFPDLEINNSGVPGATPKGVRDEATGVELATFFSTAYELNISVPIAGNQTPLKFRRQKDVVYADEYYFSMFPYRWLAGSPQTALKDPYQTVLTESRAKVYFAGMAPKDIIGKEVIYEDTIKTLVSGVVADLDEEHITDFNFKEFISLATTESSGLAQKWGWREWGSISSSSQFFVKLTKGTRPSHIEKQLVNIREKHRKKDKGDEKDMTTHFLQPLSDIHFNTKFGAFGHRTGHMPTLYGLLAVAAFLLLLGCINFINLTTAQASQRAKEIGIRKTMGSGKLQLMFQFLSETFLLTLFATLLSIAITPWLLNIFKDFIPPAISFKSLNQPHVWAFLLGLVLIVSVLSGFYPAIVLTRFKPVTVLKNQAYTGTAQTRKAWLRKTLTVTQFMIAQFLIIATFAVSKQIHYSLNKDLGYKRDAIVYINTRWNFFSKEVDNRRFVLLEKIKAIPGVQRATAAGSTPASNNTNTTTMKYLRKDKSEIEPMVEVKYADSNYFKIYEMKLLAGRFPLKSDTTREYVINENFAKLMGFQNPNDAIGEVVGDERKYPIVGVLADFHTKSTKEPIKPLAYSSADSRSFTLHIALKPQVAGSNNWKETLAGIEKEYKSVYPDENYEFKFYDEGIAEFYSAEQNISRLLKWSSALCIFISCLGLLGLAIYVTNTRTKEIGVRKVLGASVMQLLTLLSKDFIALVLVAFIIVAPLAYWIMHEWLQDFAYRTSLSWWIFAATGIGMILIAMTILSIRTLKSAMSNPVKSLRTE